MERKEKIWWITWGINTGLFSAVLVIGVIGFLFGGNPIFLVLSIWGGFMLYVYIKRLLAKIR